MNKTAAMEMSVTTIIVIVIGITLLIFAMVFVRNVMCAGIILTDKITANMENELQNLFGANDYGVKCMGEGSEEVKLGDGGTRKIACMINTDTQANYELKVTEIKTIPSTENDIIKGWVIDQDWKGSVSPGKVAHSVVTLRIPQKVSTRTIKITLDATNLDTGTTSTHDFTVDVVHVSGLTSAMC